MKQRCVSSTGLIELPLAPNGSAGRVNVQCIAVWIYGSSGCIEDYAGEDEEIGVAEREGGSERRDKLFTTLWEGSVTSPAIC